jgi:acyl-CoA synthetase (AMP-forming)/AMP-acid ligase II
VVVDVLPKSATGKVSKRGLRAQVAERRGADG